MLRPEAGGLQNELHAPPVLPARQVVWPLFYLVLASVLYQHGIAALYWILPTLYCLFWPYLARYVAGQALSVPMAERRNLLVDAVACGVLLVLMRFDLLPMVLMVLMLWAGVLVLGRWRLALAALACIALGMLLGVMLYGFRWEPETGTLTILACLPLLAVYVLQGRARFPWLLYGSMSAGWPVFDKSWPGVHRRSYWEASVSEAFARRRRGERASIVFLALDHVHPLHDSLLPGAGDEIQKALGRRLRAVLREVDLITRMDSGLFAILMPGTNQQQARLAVERIRHNLMYEEPLLTQSVVTASFCISECRPDMPSAVAWIRTAEDVMRSLWSHGRNTVVSVDEDARFGSDRAQSSAIPSREAYPSILTDRLSRGLEQSGCGLALFDPQDRLVLSNALFREWFSVQTGIQTFSDMMRYCFHHECGPVMNSTENIDTWLQAVAHMRRSEFCRKFMVDMVDGMSLRALETSFDDGWVLLVLSRVEMPETHDMSADG